MAYTPRKVQVHLFAAGRHVKGIDSPDNIDKLRVSSFTSTNLSGSIHEKTTRSELERPVSESCLFESIAVDPLGSVWIRQSLVRSFVFGDSLKQQDEKQGIVALAPRGTSCSEV